MDITGSRSKVVHRPKPQDDPRQRRPDISKAQELLGWSPKTPAARRSEGDRGLFRRTAQDEGVRAMLIEAAPA